MGAGAAGRPRSTGHLAGDQSSNTCPAAPPAAIASPVGLSAFTKSMRHGDESGGGSSLAPIMLSASIFRAI